MLIPVIFALSLYPALRLPWTLHIRWWWRALLSALLLLGLNEYTLLYAMYKGFYFCPDAPRTLLLVWNGLFMASLFTLLILLLLDVLRLPATLAMLMASPRVRNGWRSVNRKINASVMVLAAAAAVWGEYQAVKQPEIHEITLTLPHYPKGAAPLKLALLADLHADGTKRAAYLQQIVERTNALDADAILISGDFVDGSVADRGEDLKVLRGLHAPLGVWGVSGNHDVYYGNLSWVRFLQREAGVRMLMNEHVSLGPVVLAGVPDIAARGRENTVEPDLNKALAGIAPDSCIVLLAHQPKYAKEAAAHPLPVDLQLSGHTHGGQVKYLNRLWGYFSDGYVAGLYPVRDGRGMQIYVSRGTNLWTGTGFRFGVPSEIVLLTLQGN